MCVRDVQENHRDAWLTSLGTQVDQLVMVQVQSIEEMGAYVKLVSISFLVVVRRLRRLVLPPQAETGS
jgi:hypothetical protein